MPAAEHGSVRVYWVEFRRYELRRYTRPGGWDQPNDAKRRVWVPAVRYWRVVYAAKLIDTALTLRVAQRRAREHYAKEMKEISR